MTQKSPDAMGTTMDREAGRQVRTQFIYICMNVVCMYVILSDIFRAITRCTSIYVAASYLCACFTETVAQLQCYISFVTVCLKETK